MGGRRKGRKGEEGGAIITLIVMAIIIIMIIILLLSPVKWKRVKRGEGEDGGGEKDRGSGTEGEKWDVTSYCAFYCLEGMVRAAE